MIVLDTNVISELTRQVPEPGVISWLDALPAGEVGTTAVTATELLYGVARMPAGRRKTELAAAVGGLLGNDFRDRVLPFDERCASWYADIACARETLGRPIGVADAQIAAICRTAEAALATRNTDDFAGTRIELINPWKLVDQSPHDAVTGSGPGPSSGRAGLTRDRTSLGAAGLDHVARVGPHQAPGLTARSVAGESDGG